MSTRRGLPSQGSRGSLQMSAACPCSASGRSVAMACPAGGGASAAEAGVSPAVGCSLTRPRYPRDLSNHKRPTTRTWLGQRRRRGYGGNAGPCKEANVTMGEAAAYLVPETACRMAAAARAFLLAASVEQRPVLNPGFDGLDVHSPRRQWTYLPEPVRPGLPLRELPDPQRKLAHELITASVSMEGYAKVVSVMAMEHVRRALMLASAPERAHLFDPERYCFRIFGDPGGTVDGQPAPWGWQLAGHHVSLNFTVAGGYVSGTPCMFGSVPASYGTLSPLEHEETEGFAFVNGLSAEQRSRAVIWHRTPPDFATRIVPRIGEVELPDHVFPPEPDYRISDEEREALAYVRSGPRGIGGADLPAEQLHPLGDPGA